MNWRLGLLLIVLVVVFAVITAIVIRKTEFAQGRVEMFQSRLAGTAQDALSNVVVVQSFTRLNAEARMFGDIVRQVLDHQFPVLNWWAVVTRADPRRQHPDGHRHLHPRHLCCTSTARRRSARSSASWASPPC